MINGGGQISDKIVQIMLAYDEIIGLSAWGYVYRLEKRNSIFVWELLADSKLPQ